jgi:hypothetical protein
LIGGDELPTFGGGFDWSSSGTAFGGNSSG